MSNVKEALAKWDAADELLAEKVEKCVKSGWTESEITSGKGTVDTTNTWCVKSGNIVTFRFRTTALTTTGNWETIAVLPYKPVKNPAIVLDMQNMAVFNITGSGNIQKYATISNATVDISGTYITND